MMIDVPGSNVATPDQESPVGPLRSAAADRSNLEFRSFDPHIGGPPAYNSSQ